MRMSVILMSCWLMGGAPVPAEVIRLSPDDNWFELLHGNRLKPGDEVILSAGTYTDRRKLTLEHRGTRAAPITIRAAQGARAIIKRPDARQNTINMLGVQHLILKDLEITGGSAGIRIFKSGDTMAR
ncbi:MAG: chondroitinase-B domain-containing protein, partial [Verrucomicrobiota bacterium]